MQAIVDKYIWFSKSEVPMEFLDEIRRKFIYDNPTYADLLSMGKPAINVPRVIRSFRETETHLYLARGTGKYLRELCEKYGIEYGIKDNRILKLPISTYLADNTILTPSQAIARDRMIGAQQGNVVAACGGGKTVLCVGLIASISQPTCILVHQIHLLKQWVKELTTKLKGDYTIGQICGSSKKIGDITIATIQTLNNFSKEEMMEFAHNFGMVIVDEAHHVPACTFLQVINAFPAKYRFGVTATPNRKDKKEFLLFDTIGNIIHEITDEELAAEGRITSASVEQINTNFVANASPDKWTQVVTALCMDQARNDMIIDRVIKDADFGHIILILSDRVKHCLALKRMLQKRGFSSELLIGNVSKEKREQIRQDVIGIRTTILIGTKVADEGLDIPNLSCLHMTTPCNNKSLIKQRCGRIRRKDKTKLEPVVRDYVDRGVPFLKSVANNRSRWYTEWGFQKI